MNMYKNIEDFYILRENLLDKFIWNAFHIINRVKMNKLRRKNKVLPSFKQNIL